MSWTMPVYRSYKSQCQMRPACQRQCMAAANKCTQMCQYNTQCNNMCNEALLQCVTTPRHEPIYYYFH